MEITTILLIICIIGWALTLYIYSKKFKNLVDSNAQRVKGKLNETIEKARGDNRKEQNDQKE